MKIEFEVTQEQLAALAHDIADPEAWLKNAFDELFVKHVVTARLDGCIPRYEAAKAELGDAYKSRAERDADDAAAEEARSQERLKAAHEAQIAANARFAAAVQAEVERVNKRNVIDK